MTPERMRDLVSAILLTGVVISAALICIGFAGSLAVGWQGSLTGAPPSDHAMTDFGGLASDLRVLRPVAISQLGLVVLVATPIVRVAASLVAFALERDRLYVGITAIVLGILLASALFIR